MLQNMFAASIECMYGDEDDEIVFMYEDTLSRLPSTDPSVLQCSSLHPASSCGFPGDSLVGFTHDIICATSMFFLPWVTPSWASSSWLDSSSSVESPYGLPVITVAALGILSSTH